MQKCKAILLMGGSGSRFGKETKPKQFLPLGGKPLYEQTLAIFEKSALFSDIILVAPKMHPVRGSVTGGSTRQESSYQGLLACGDDTDFVLIHDAVRPFVSIDILKRNMDAVSIHHAVNTCIPTYDTINYVKDHKVSSIPDRSSCMRGQTPQTFSYPLILEAHKKTATTNSVDDCSLVLELGYPVHVVLGSDQNFKITTEFDYLLATWLWQQM